MEKMDIYLEYSDNTYTNSTHNLIEKNKLLEQLEKLNLNFNVCITLEYLLDEPL